MGNKFQNLPELRFPRSYTPTMRRKIVQAGGENPDVKSPLVPAPDIQKGELAIFKQGPKLPKKSVFYGE